MNNLFRFLTLATVLGLGALSLRAEYFYVATNGAGGDYKSWAAAATNIQDAVNAATNDDIVLVSNGVYTTTTLVFAEGSNSIALTNRITLKSVNGPAVTVIDGNYPAITARVVFVSQRATLDGFTVRNGFIAWSSCRGGGININNRGANDADVSYYGGTVTNCIVHNNFSYDYGGGISSYATTGVVANCTIYSNSCVYNGGGIYLGWPSSGTMVNNCVIWGNSTGHDGNPGYGGGGLYNYAGRTTVKNCLFYKNRSLRNGGGVMHDYWYSLVLENCTIVSNAASDSGGGFYMATANTEVVLRNTIIYSNSATVNYADAFTTNQNVLANSCIGNTNGVQNWDTSGNITNNPQFIDAANNNYRLLSASPCINTGTNQAWMTGGVDLDGKPRIRYRWVDMGVYEHINRGTIYGFQ